MRIDVAGRVHSRASRTAASLGTCFILVAMSVPMAPSAQAASAPAKAAEAVGPSGAPLPRKAAPTEMPSLRTTYSNTYILTLAPHCHANSRRDSV